MIVYGKIFLYFILCYLSGVQCSWNRKRLEFHFRPRSVQSSNSFNIVNYATFPITTLHATTSRSMVSSVTNHEFTTTLITHNSTNANNELSSIITNRPPRKHTCMLEEDKEDLNVKNGTCFITERAQTLDYISSQLPSYFLRIVVHDFAARILKKAQPLKMLTSSELSAVKNICHICLVDELNSTLNMLLTIMEKYPVLHNDNSLAEHVATEYEQASDYLNRKIIQLSFEMNALRRDSDFYSVKRQYERRERNGGIMQVLLDWYETYVRKGTDNENDIQQKLLKYLNIQKRYWLISFRGII